MNWKVITLYVWGFMIGNVVARIESSIWEPAILVVGSYVAVFVIDRKIRE